MSAPHILVVDDESEIRSLLKEILSDEGYDVEVAADAGEARSLRARRSPDLVLLDIWMPDTDGITLLREWTRPPGLSCPVVMMSGHGTVETAVEATRLGAFDFVEKPLSLAKLLRTVERAIDAGRESRQTSRTLVPPMLAPVGRSRMMQQLREQVQQVAQHDTPVLILGEPGTGREAFARYLHAQSARAEGPFIPLIAAGVTEDSANASLHGSDGGAKAGAIEQAEGGVLFVNGLEDLVPAAQRLLLADLEMMSYTPAGASQPRRLDVRFVCSAQPGLTDDPARHGVRPDLLAQLNVVTLRVPPLRDYAEDVPELLRYYVDRLVDQERLPLRRFSVAAQNRRRNYPWPGTSRELKNLVHRRLIRGGDEEIGLDEVE
ncbi:MAG TPA: sigma-54 dependent transcriptional regulator, partial [Steroidobacteraceae bacterium]|nr:sigma-54 dependent transcriptional regulator [Steroidobacteraceae bacterium]